MAEMKEPPGRRGTDPERVAVYDRPDEPAAPVNTTGTTGMVRKADGNLPVGWLLAAVAVVLVIVAVLWWV